MNVQETKEQLIAELIRLAFAEEYRRWRPYDFMLHSGYGNGEEPADRERRRRIGRCRNG